MRRLSGIVACLAVVTAMSISAAPASAGSSLYETAFVCEYKALWEQRLPTHRCQLKMRKAVFFKSSWYNRVSWYYCVRYPASASDGGHQHRPLASPRLLPAYTECYPPGDYVFYAYPGIWRHEWVHSHRRGKHWVYWYVLTQGGWEKVASWWFTNALHFHV